MFQFDETSYKLSAWWSGWTGLIDINWSILNDWVSDGKYPDDEDSVLT